ncbi:MAG TPA: tyrosine--tRNA ligase [Gemmatimonadales bacterium]|nr:tyrosine--tRNA ligase [Gemmatimonadales bacterium]
MHRFLSELAARGFVADMTPHLEARLATGRPITGYVGFDPTADSLHVGSLVPVMGLAWLQRLGGRPVVLVGGGTGLVGDPSGKRAERPMLSAEEVAANTRRIADQLRRFVSFEGPTAALLADNAAWLGPLTLMDFLRDTGKHFTVNYMLQKESVKARMESGISFTEFAYMLVQAHDFWHLYRTERCELQMGGTDQWGNITAGVELIHRREGAQAHGLVFPLLTTSSGSKFGKSEGQNIWLDPARTSPYKFYQFWLNQEDADVERLLKLFTFLPLEEIAALVAAHAADPGKRAGQRKLAWEVTALVHGPATADRVVEASGLLFGGAVAAHSAHEAFAELVDEIPTLRLAREQLTAGVALADVLVQAGLAASKGEARRGIEQKGFSVNGEKLDDPARLLGPADLRGQRFVLLAKGKKNYAMVVVG